MVQALILSLFSLGYLFVVFERPLKIHRAAVILLTTALVWIIYLIGSPLLVSHRLDLFFDKISDVAQILFFLMGSMALVELIDSHQGFRILTRKLEGKTKKQFLWLFAFLIFFLSAILDSITTTLVMLSFMRTLSFSRKEQIMLGSLVIMAANAGGVWTPMGDTTTTLLWIHEKISTLGIVKSLFFPSLAYMVVPLLFFTPSFKGKLNKASRDEAPIPGAHLILVLGILGLLLVPLLQELWSIPPCIGVFFALGVAWMVTDCLHSKYEKRQHLRVPHILTRLDTSGILFLLGVLLAIDALQVSGLLEQPADFLKNVVRSEPLIATILGGVSSIVDNIPLVAALISMYATDFPIDSPFWIMVAYAVGTGGSIFVIGSSAGILWMGLEKIDFMTYLKVATLPATCAFFTGLFVYFF